MIRSMSGRDVVSSPPAEEEEEEQTLETQEVKEEQHNGEPDNTASGSIRPFNRLVTTSAVAAALAEVQGTEAQAAVERPKRRRLDRRHSGGLEPQVEAGKEPSDDVQAYQGHRMSAPSVDSVPEHPTLVVIKPMRVGSASPRTQLKRVTSTHLSGIRERLKSAGQANSAAGSTVKPVKRTPSVSTMPTFKRTPSSMTRAGAVSSTAGANAATTTNGQNYEQMMARFQLRRLEPSDSQRSVGNEAKTLIRRSNAYMRPMDSEISNRRMDDTMNSRRHSEGEAVGSTVEQKDDGEIMVSSRSREDESPRRPGAPSFHSSAASIAPPATATVTPVGYFGSASGALEGSMRSNASAVKNVQSTTTPDHEQTPNSQLGEKKEQTIVQHQQPGAKRYSVGEPVMDRANFQQLTSRSVGRPRPLPRLKKRARDFLIRLRTPLSPFSRTARVRGFILLAAFCFHALGFPYELAFHGGGRVWFMCLDSMTEIVFVADFLLAFNTSFVNKRGVLVVSRRHIAWNFLSGAGVFQLVAATPLMTGYIVLKGSAENVMMMEIEEDAFKQFSHALIDFAMRSHRIVHLLRLLREVGQVSDARIDKSVLGWLLYSRYSHLLRIVWIVGAVMLIAHCVACCWRLLLTDSATVDPASIVARTCGARIEPNAELKVYAECFYVAMQMLQGQSLTTYSARENVFASCVNLLGSVVLAVIFGHVAMLVANFNANSTAYQRKMESVFAGMSKMQLPAPLRERIHQYYAHLWREYEALDGAPLERFAKELSHNLTLEVVLFKYMELAMHVPFWEKCSPDFQKTLVLSLDTRVYLPDDFIVRRGEVGDEFYMINRGMCELVGSNDTLEHATEPLARRRSQLSEHSEHPADTSTLYTTSHDGTVYPDRDDLGHNHHRGARASAYVSPDGVPQANGTLKTLTRGQALGEMALLMNYQRTANVRAMTYVEMCVLSRTAFQAVLTRYPADRKHVISQILISSLENNERFGIPCPLTAMVRSVFDGEVDGVASGEKLITPRRAAKLIAWAVNPDVEDDSIKFALSSKLKEQLAVVRDQEFSVPTDMNEGTSPQAATRTTTSPSSSGVNRKRSHGEDDRKECGCACNCGDSATSGACHSSEPSKPEPEVDSQVVKLEGVQAQALALIQELRRGAQDTLHPQPPQPSSSDAENGSTSTASSDSPAPRTCTKTVDPQQRRSMFISSRSTSTPNFANLDATVGGGSSINLNKTTEQNRAQVEPSVRSKPPLAPRKPIQRAMTSRWLKTSEINRPLRNANSSVSSGRSRAVGSSSQRFIQRVTKLASLATSNSTAQASPTRYADQLFGTTQAGLEAAPCVKEMSYRDDSNVSEARY